MEENAEHGIKLFVFILDLLRLLQTPSEVMTSNHRSTAVAAAAFINSAPCSPALILHSGTICHRTMAAIPAIPGHIPIHRQPFSQSSQELSGVNMNEADRHRSSNTRS